MKEAFYFPHDYNARNDQKILALRSDFGLAGYALFFMLLETMAEETNGRVNRVAIGGLSVSYGITKDELLKFVECCIEIGLFLEDDSGIYSKRMIEHKSFRNKLSEGGKKGASKRWHSPPISSPISPPNAKESKGKESKGKEIKGNENKEKEIENNLTIFSVEKTKDIFLKQSDQWIEQVAMNYRSDTATVRTALVAFLNKQELSGEIARTINQLKSHFINTFEKTKPSQTNVIRARTKAERGLA